MVCGRVSVKPGGAKLGGRYGKFSGFERYGLGFSKL